MTPWVSVVGYLSLDNIDAGPLRPGGAALYAALGARAAGARVRLVAQVGADFPASVLAGLAALGVDTRECRPSVYPCRRTRLQDHGDHRDSPHFADAAWWQATEQLAPPRAWDGAAGYLFTAMPPWVLAGQLRKRPVASWLLADTSEAFATQERRRLLALLPLLDVFAPSLAESRCLLPQRPDALAAQQLARRGPMIVVKAGAAGLRSLADPTCRVPSRASQVVDTTGAGDAVCGALLAGLVRGLAPPRLLTLASRIAARAVATPGTAGLGLETTLCT